jgi:3-oxoacyl-[acyl-carrier-protein] synthase II
MNRRVVITGGSIISPIGVSKEEIVQNLMNGVSGIKPLKRDDLLTDYIHSGVFGTVDTPIEYNFSRRDRKTMGPVSYYACYTAREALKESNLENEYITSGRLGVAYGSTHGSPTVQRDIYKTFFSGSSSEYSSINAVDYLKSMSHTTAVNITKMFGITGRVLSSCTACTTSSQSIGFGYEMIKYGMQDAMICGGADEYDTTTVAVFDNLLACSTDFNHAPHLTPRPFDRHRDGLVVGEGAAALVLEEYEFAKMRGAPILGEIIGFSCNNNGGDLIMPNMEGIQETIRLGLESAALQPGQVDFVSAHATGTKIGDVTEAKAIQKMYGQSPYVSGLKSYVGHTMAACGGIETMFTLYMMDAGVVPPTLNLDNVDPRCDIIRHVQDPINVDVDIATIQNFAFGGVNTCLFIRKDVNN